MMQKNCRPSATTLLLLCCTIVYGLLAGRAQAQQYRVESNREENSVTLTCIDPSTGNPPVQNPQFFRDTTIRVDGQPGFSVSGTNGHRLAFRITRELEGGYSCGTPNVQSDPILLTARPTRSESVPEPNPTFVLVGGQRVQLNCAISPGNLIQQYFVTWYRSDERIYQIQKDGRIYNTAERYSHNPSNLALIIRNVELNDTADDYHCVLSVVDPKTQMTDSYASILRNIDIRLFVLANPEIIYPPESKILSTANGNDQEVSFSCTATGYPSPEITWIYRDRQVRQNDNNPRPVTVQTTEQDHIVTSTLTFRSVSVFNSGRIECMASVPPDASTGSIQLTRDEALARLSVLGQFTDVAVRITVDRDTIFDLDLPVRLEDPLRLYLEYTDVASGRLDVVKTSAMYTNLSNIRHIEFDSDVMFDRFRVSVALEFVDGTRGPVRAAGQYDKRMPNTPLTELIRQIPVIAICSVLSFVTICALILGIIVAIFCYNIQKKKLEGPEKRFQNGLKDVDKDLDQSKNVYSAEAEHMKNQDKSVASTIVNRHVTVESSKPCKNFARSSSCPSSNSHKRCSRPFQKFNSIPIDTLNSIDLESGQPASSNRTDHERNPNRVSDDGPEESREQISKSSYAVTNFLANKLYAGLKHPTHGRKFRQIVNELMNATKPEGDKDHEDSESETATFVSRQQNIPSHSQSLQNGATALYIESQA